MSNTRKLSFEDYCNNDEYRIVPSRLCLSRKKLNWDQKTFLEKLNDLEIDKGDIEHPLSPSVCSAWESGRRPVATKHNQNIANLLNVSIAYLLGLNDDPEKEESDFEVDDNTVKAFHYRKEIPANRLYMYNEQPIYIEFTDYSHPNGWGIYLRNEAKIIMANESLYEMQINKNARFYVYENASEKPSDIKKNITYHEMLNSSSLYIEMLTGDENIKKMYNDWYFHNREKGCLENKYGLTLPYEGLSISYIAYENNLEKTEKE